MNIKRTMPIGEILSEAGVFDEKNLDKILEQVGEEIEIDIEVTVTEEPVPAFISGPPENCHPAEGGEFDVDPCPEEVASMILKQIVAAMPERLVLPTIIEATWLAIVEREQHWQDNSLADKVWDNYT